VVGPFLQVGLWGRCTSRFPWERVVRRWCRTGRASSRIRCTAQPGKDRAFHELQSDGQGEQSTLLRRSSADVTLPLLTPRKYNRTALPLESHVVSPSPPPSPPPASRINLLRCLTCSKTVECSPTDALKFTKTGWPRCCGEVMTMFIPTSQPGDPPQGRKPP
jgi:hypothetical protein